MKSLWSFLAESFQKASKNLKKTFLKENYKKYIKSFKKAQLENFQKSLLTELSKITKKILNITSLKIFCLYPEPLFHQ